MLITMQVTWQATSQEIGKQHHLWSGEASGRRNLPRFHLVIGYIRWKLVTGSSGFFPFHHEILKTFEFWRHLKSQLVGEETCETRYTRRFVISNPTKCCRWMMQLFSHWSDTWAIKVPTKGFSRINFEILKFWKIRRHHPIRNEITVLLSYSSRKTVKPTNRETFLKKIDFFRRYQPVFERTSSGCCCDLSGYRLHAV